MRKHSFADYCPADRSLPGWKGQDKIGTAQRQKYPSLCNSAKRPVIHHMSYSLNSLKGVIQGSIIGLIRGDARSLDYG